MRAVEKFARVGRPGPRRLQRISDSVRSGPAAGRAAAQCRDCDSSAARCTSAWKPRTRRSPAPRKPGQVLQIPIAHGEGNYFCDEATLAELERNHQIVFRYYRRPTGREDATANPNGSLASIAGVCNRERNVVGLMPHPERAVEAALGSADGLVIFRSLIESLTRAAFGVTVCAGVSTAFLRDHCLALRETPCATRKRFDTKTCSTPKSKSRRTGGRARPHRRGIRAHPENSGARSELHRARHLQRDVERALLLQIEHGASEAAADARRRRCCRGRAKTRAWWTSATGWPPSFKMESHNHPSYVEPFQGAATGVGGILRDIFTMGARPIAVLDSLRFGPITPGAAAGTRRRKTIARNRRILDGVVRGIAYYGNCFGVPTVGGEVHFEPGYSTNPLVNVLALGIARKEDLFLREGARRGQSRDLRGRENRARRHSRRVAAGFRRIHRGIAAEAAQRAGGRPVHGKAAARGVPRSDAAPARSSAIQDMGAAGLTSSSLRDGVARRRGHRNRSGARAAARNRA